MGASGDMFGPWAAYFPVSLCQGCDIVTMCVTFNESSSVQTIKISTCGLYHVMEKLLFTFPSPSHSSRPLSVCGKKVYMNTQGA